MAIRLPVLPSAKHVPQVASPADPGLQTSSSMFGAAEAGGIEEVGGSAQFIGLGLQEAARRKQSRDDAIQNSRLFNQRNRERQEAFNTARGTQDFSDPAVFNSFLQQQDAADLELLNNYQGSEEGRIELEEQLFGLSDRYTGAAIDEHAKAALAAAEVTVNEQADPLIIQLFRQPDRAPQTFAELAAVARRVAPVFDTITEDQLLRTLNDKASSAIIEGLRSRPDAAQAALNDLIAEGKISSDLAIDAQRRIDNLQVELDLRATAGSGEGDLVALPDPSLSTGFRFVPKVAGGEAPAPEAEGSASLSDASTFRSQFSQQSSDFVQMRDAYGKVRTAVENPSPAGDVSLVFGFMRLVDPSSTVREGEFATAEQTTNVPGFIRNQYNKLVTGERLTDDQRADFAGQAHNLFTAQLSQQERLQTEWQGIATRSGLDPSIAVPDFIGPTREWAPVEGKPSAASQQSLSETVGQELKKFGIELDLTGAENASDVLNRLATSGDLDKLPEPVANLLRGVAASDKTAVGTAVQALGVDGFAQLPDAVQDEVARILGVEMQ